MQFQEELRGVGLVSDEEGRTYEGVTGAVAIRSLPVIGGYAPTPELRLFDFTKDQLTTDGDAAFEPPFTQCAVYYVALHNDTLVSPRRAADGWISIHVTEEDRKFVAAIE
jgi:hypothetical protein